MIPHAVPCRAIRKQLVFSQGLLWQLTLVFVFVYNNYQIEAYGRKLMP